MVEIRVGQRFPLGMHLSLRKQTGGAGTREREKSRPIYLCFSFLFGSKSKRKRDSSFSFTFVTYCLASSKSRYNSLLSFGFHVIVASRKEET